jgi:hypothetical protein
MLFLEGYHSTVIRVVGCSTIDACRGKRRISEMTSNIVNLCARPSKKLTIGRRCTQEEMDYQHPNLRLRPELLRPLWIEARAL